MVKVVLAGTYPKGTFDKIRMLLPRERFDLVAVDTMEAYEKLTDAEIMILRIFKAQKEVLERNTNLKMVMRWGAGYDSVDIETAGKRGIIVTNTPGANANAVSELTVLLMLAIYRKLISHTESLHSGIWSKNTFLNNSFCLCGKTVGLIGSGNIGLQVAKKVVAFGARVQYYDLFRLSEDMENIYQMQYSSLENLISTSDIISLHVPLMESTRHIIGEKEIASMKKGAVLINTARGGLIDDCALVRAIANGHLLGAGLDGVESEPLPAEHDLLQNPGIIVTPHIGGGTADLGDAIIPMLIQDIFDYCETGKCSHIVNGQYLRCL